MGRFILNTVCTKKRVKLTRLTKNSNILEIQYFKGDIIIILTKRIDLIAGKKII